MQISPEEQSAIERLRGHLLKTIEDENKRLDLEQFILILYFEVLKYHVGTKLSFLVEQIIEKGEFQLYVPHIPRSENGPDQITLRHNFLSEVYGLCSFTFGPDSEGDFRLELGEYQQHIEKYFFSELGSLKIVSKELELGELFPNTLVSEIQCLL